MKTRYKSPSGTGVIELSDDSSVGDLCGEIRAKTGIQDFTIKYGPPMAMQTLDMTDTDQSTKSRRLHGETLTIVPNEPATDPLAGLAGTTSVMHQQARGKSNSGDNPEDLTIPWPEREGTLLLRVMPSDNSCLFTAFGGALPTQIPADKLRRMMSDYISQHRDLYTEGILGSSPSQYCRSIQDPDRWGGGIELSILSTIFDIQISTFDVQTQSLINFGEHKKDRCVLVYSGIHYDRVAFTYSDFPHEESTLPPEMDRTLWPTDDNAILEKTQELVGKLNKAHYYTDTEGLILKCDVPGCDWIGNGQAEGSKHAQETGHLEMSEIHDTDEDNVLRSCDVEGCDFMGQGSKVIRQHTIDTGHGQYSVIPDY